MGIKINDTTVTLKTIARTSNGSLILPVRTSDGYTYQIFNSGSTVLKVNQTVYVNFYITGSVTSSIATGSNILLNVSSYSITASTADSSASLSYPSISQSTSPTTTITYTNSIATASIYTPTTNSTIYYSTQSLTPNTSSNLYTAPIYFSQSCIISAISYRDY